MTDLAVAKSPASGRAAAACRPASVPLGGAAPTAPAADDSEVLRVLPPDRVSGKPLLLPRHLALYRASMSEKASLPINLARERNMTGEPGVLRKSRWMSWQANNK